MLLCLERILREADFVASASHNLFSVQCQLDGRKPRVLVSNRMAGTQTSTNWSGAVVTAPANDSFKWMEGDWTVPNVDAPTENQWYYCASWIGIDGDGSNDVFQ